MVKLDIAPTGYHVLHAHQGSSGDHGRGGIAIIYRDSVKATVSDVGKHSTFEALCVHLSVSCHPHVYIQTAERCVRGLLGRPVESVGSAGADRPASRRLPISTSQKLQRVRNSLARVVLQQPVTGAVTHPYTLSS